MVTKRLCILFKLSIALILLVSLVAISACSPEPQQKPKKKPPAKQTAKQEQKKEDIQEIQNGQVAKTIWPFGFEKEIVGEVQPESVADKMTTRNFVIIFDDSGSMADPDADGHRKIDTAKKAVVEWSKSVPTGANVGLVSFHKRIEC